MTQAWSQPIRVECTEHIQLITSKTINSKLWFVNNKKLQQRIIAYLAKYTHKYKVQLYAFVIVGNHYHLLARFPYGNRSQFCRDFNARIAEAVRFFVPQFGHGPLFQRRFTTQVVPLEQDVEKYFLYCALQPVSSGLCSNIREYNSYNSFFYSSRSISSTHAVFNSGAYNAARKKGKRVKKEEYIEYYSLNYCTLPGYESLSKNLYQSILDKLVKNKQKQLVKDRLERGKSFLGIDKLLKVIPGQSPLTTKQGGVRPLVLSCCHQAKREFLDLYFSIVEQFKVASRRYRYGEYAVDFPPGTFRPPGVTIITA